MHSTTSELRRGLCQAICSAAYVGTPKEKRDLAEQLDALPFESMSDTALLAMARTWVDPQRIAWLQKHKSAEHEAILELVLCRECHDQHVVEIDPGRWATCRTCQRPKEETDAT